jgi:uncharacterized protein YdcH (DUF465 family)
MSTEKHNLANEFPEFKEQIHNLKLSNNHFKKLFEEYELTDKEVYRIEQKVETASEAYEEELKKKRLKLKDELFHILKLAS